MSEESLHKILGEIEPADRDWRRRAVDSLRNRTMPTWALGRLLDLAVDLVGMSRTFAVPTRRKRIVLMAGDHGVTVQGVCSQPTEITRQMISLFLQGGAGINVLAEETGCDLTLVDMGVDADLREEVASGRVLDGKLGHGTADWTRGPAMSREQALAGIDYGIRLTESLDRGTDVFGVGEMGIGNSTCASAILTVLTETADPTSFVGRGAGLDDDGLRRKIDAIRRGIEWNRPDPSDPIDVLAKVGGFEVAGLVGVILGAARLRKPVLLDGFITGSAAMIAAALVPHSVDYMIASHQGAEPGHRRMLDWLGKTGLLEWGLRLGEGTGAALASRFLDDAVAILSRMATLEESAVSFRRPKNA